MKNMKTFIILLLFILTLSSSLPIHKLKKQLEGDVLVPGDPGYEDALFIDNGYYNYIKPKAVVVPKSIRDIQKTILFAKKHKAKFAVKGGGHSAAGNHTTQRVSYLFFRILFK